MRARVCRPRFIVALASLAQGAGAASPPGLRALRGGRRRARGAARSPLPRPRIGPRRGGAAPEPPPTRAPDPRSARRRLPGFLSFSRSPPALPCPAPPGRLGRAGSAALRFRLAAGRKLKGGAGGGRAAMHIHQGARGGAGGSRPEWVWRPARRGRPSRVAGLVFVRPGWGRSARGRLGRGAPPARPRGRGLRAPLCFGRRGLGAGARRRERGPGGRARLFAKE